jgi:hypothetical protein
MIIEHWTTYAIAYSDGCYAISDGTALHMYLLFCPIRGGITAIWKVKLKS